MRELIIAACLLPLMVACKDNPVPPTRQVPVVESATKEAPTAERAPTPEGEYVKVANVRASQCRRTLCIGGPGEIGSDPNRDLGELCRRTPGVVQRCEGERCSSVWPVERWRAGLDALIDSLDQNDDGKVDGEDPSCPLSLAGWSTGGAIVSTTLPQALTDDARVDSRHAEIQHLLVIAPYIQGPEPKSEQLAIAPTVRKAFIYRYTEPAAGDCSRAFEGGPWVSPKPVCGDDTLCYDYDYSQDRGELAYLGRRGARSGAEVGHCNIVSLIAKIGLDNLSRGEEAYQQLIPPYSDGSHGGRIPVAGPAKPDPIYVLPNEPEPD